MSLRYNRITTILFFIGLFVMISLYCAIPIEQQVAEGLHVDKGSIALSSVCFSLSFAIGCLFYGILSDKFGRKVVISAGLLILTIMTLAITFAQSFQYFIILRSLQGLFAATFSPVALTYVTEMFPARKRVTAISFISTGFLLAGVIGQIFSELIASSLGWQYVFLILSVIYLVSLIAVIFFIPKSPYKQADIDIISFFSNFKSISKNKSIILAYIIAFLLLMSFVNMYAVLNLYLNSPQINAGTEVAYIIKLLGVIGMILSLTSGRLSDRYSVKTVLFFALLFGSVFLILLGLSENILIIGTLSVLFVTCVSFAVPSLISKIGLLTKENKGFFLSVNTFLLFLGTAVSPIIIGYIQAIGNYTIMFTSIGALLFIGFIASTCLPKIR
ncbi:MFS transporter [Staphylococcus massiliensis]|nr:MFS transporter [Staphylococcus massiliensis]PNZ97825.1 MFS transporter [Staphylococcus massiliensis CCUG 55927]